MTHQHYSIAEIEKMNAAAVNNFDPNTRWTHGRFTHHMMVFAKVQADEKGSIRLHNIFSNACECGPMILCGNCGERAPVVPCLVEGHLYHYILHRDFV